MAKDEIKATLPSRLRVWYGDVDRWMLLKEAADEIERLTKQNESLQREIVAGHFEEAEFWTKAIATIPERLFPDDGFCAARARKALMDLQRERYGGMSEVSKTSNNPMALERCFGRRFLMRASSDAISTQVWNMPCLGCSDCAPRARESFVFVGKGMPDPRKPQKEPWWYGVFGSRIREAIAVLRGRA